MGQEKKADEEVLGSLMTATSSRTKIRSKGKERREPLRVLLLRRRAERRTYRARPSPRGGITGAEAPGPRTFATHNARRKTDVKTGLRRWTSHYAKRVTDKKRPPLFMQPPGELASGAWSSENEN
ncbi:hypothetical protein KM043_015250 [Ampulex compressa]|nr:hypothetical protein KM043_015250 [Ampulex compressa]